MKKTKIALLILLMASISLTGLKCTKGPTRAELEAAKPVTIKWWRVFDEKGSVKPIIDAYRALHPNVSIEYRKIRFDEYEKELLNALAEDRGPDIISLHNTWIPEYLPKLAPMPPTVTIPYTEIKGMKKEVQIVLKTKATNKNGAVLF